MPHVVLAEATLRASTLRSLGNILVNGKRQDVITYATENGQQMTLYFDSQTRLLTKYEFLTSRNVIGDAVTELIFAGYHDQDGIKIPSTRKSFTSGIPVSDIHYDNVKVYDGGNGLTTNLSMVPRY